MNEKTTRCVQCDAEFSDGEIQGATGCPKCGTSSVPCSINQDTTVKLNWHELRILTLWADNWAQRECGAPARKSLAAIIQRLQAQGKTGWPALTLAGEVLGMQHEGIEAELRDADGNVIVPRPVRN